MASENWSGKRRTHFLHAKCTAEEGSRGARAVAKLCVAGWRARLGPHRALRFARDSHVSAGRSPVSLLTMMWWRRRMSSIGRPTSTSTLWPPTARTWCRAPAGVSSWTTSKRSWPLARSLRQLEHSVGFHSQILGQVAQACVAIRSNMDPSMAAVAENGERALAQFPVGVRPAALALLTPPRTLQGAAGCACAILRASVRDRPTGFLHRATPSTFLAGCLVATSLLQRARRRLGAACRVAAALASLRGEVPQRAAAAGGLNSVLQGPAALSTGRTAAAPWRTA